MTEQERIENRFRAWYQLATAKQRAEGKAWYREARAFARELSRTYGIPLVQVCGVIAALSPSVAWDVNKRQAEALCRAFSNGGDLADVVVSTYGKQAAKAREIIQLAKTRYDELDRRGLIFEILGVRAFKTWAFFDNIYRLNGQDVTIDQHIIMAADFAELWTQSAKWCYDLLARSMRKVAEELKLKPHQLQAIIWLTYKETKESAEIPI